MAFTYDKINDMENIVKATGLSEDELARLIIAKENEGWSNAEIVDLLASNFDNKEYASKAQNELDALYSLGFKPSKDYNPAGGKRYQQWQEYKEDPSLVDRFKSWFAANRVADEQRNAAARESIAKSVNDWRDSHPEQWRVGMVNAMFGDNSLLSQYYSAKHAAEEGEKNRQAQREYNQYLKEYDKAQADAKERQAKKIELAGLYKDYNNAQGAQEKALIKDRIDALEDELGLNNVKGKMTEAYEQDKADKAKAESDESVRQRNAMNIKAKIIGKINKAKSDADKQKLLDEFNAEFAKSRSVAKEDLKATTAEEFVSAFNDAGIKQEDYANLTQEDANEINAKILNFETQEAANKGAVKGAIASGVADDVKTAREEKKKAEELHKLVLQNKVLWGEEKALHDKYYPSK